LTQTLQQQEYQELQERLHRRERELQAVRRITAALHARTDLDELQRQTLDAAVEIVGAESGTIFLHDPARSVLIFKYVIGEKAGELTGREMPDDKGTVGAVFRDGQGRITEDTTRDADHFRAIDQQTDYVTRNMVTVPLRTMAGQNIGAMQVLNKRVGVFDQADLDVLEILGSLAASFIYTARLHDEARLAEVVHRIGDISHDVKNMVTPVMTGTQTLELMLQGMYQDVDVLLADPTTPPELASQLKEAIVGVRDWYPEAVEMTYDGVVATQERVREIADAIKGTIAAPQFEPTNVNDIARQVARPLSLVAERAGITIDLNGLGDVPPADLDRKGIYNALYNLVNNAIPETPSGGSISVRTAVVADDSDKEWLQVEVADTGRGMPEAVRAKLFTDQAKSTKVGGTGLGTLIVKRAVDAHGGSISLASQEGVGTTFTLRFPLHQLVKG
jgi:signal transduction histidine kinase